MKKIIRLCLFSLLLIGGIFLCYKPKKSGFALSKICIDLAYRPEWDAAHPSSLNEVLSQKFVYLARGAQSYAFVSADQKYVLKFFNMEHLTPKTWLKYIPRPFLEGYRARKVDRREKRLKETFTAIKKAYEELKDETGLYFVHLNRTSNLNKKIVLIDRQGIEWDIDLDKTAFIIQEKAELIYCRFAKLIERGDIDELEEAKESILKLIAKRCEKGFSDNDTGVQNNYGFVGKRPIQIDLGELIKNDTLKPDLSAEVQRVRRKIDDWIKKNHK